MTLSKFELVFAAGIGGIAVLAQTAGAMPAPDDFWPTSVVGWINVVVGIGTAMGLIYAFHRFTQKPALDAVAELRQWMKDQRLEAESDTDEKLNHFRQSTSAEINGFGLRVKSLEETAMHANGLLDGLRQSMIESKKDREHMSQMMERFGRDFDAYRKEQREREDRIMDAINGRRGDR